MHFLLPLDAVDVRGVALVHAKFGAAHRHAEAAPEIVAVAADVDSTVGGRKCSVRNAVEVVGAGKARGWLFIHLHTSERDSHHREHALDQTQVDESAAAEA